MLTFIPFWSKDAINFFFECNKLVLTKENIFIGKDFLSNGLFKLNGVHFSQTNKNDYRFECG